MKEFVVPDVEVVRFAQKDILTVSCGCVECSQCPDKDSCTYDY